jgi:two-component system sensor histidine kinase KdpD
MAQGMGGDLYVVYIDAGRDTSPEDKRTLAENVRFAENLGAKIVRVKGKRVAEEMAKVVRENHITQVIFGRSARTGWQKYLYLNAIQRFLTDAPAVDVHIVTQEER